jgi:excisionase family DNA binding protein
MTPDQALQAADAELEKAERLLSVARAAQELGCCRETVRRLIKRGVLHGSRLGPLGWYRVSRVAILKIKAEQTPQT